MDIPSLTVFLSPFLPFLVKGGEAAANEAGKKFGVDAWETAKAIWGKLSPKVEAKEAAKEATEDVANNPEDSTLQTVLQVQLKKLLEQDSVLAKEIEELMQKDSLKAATTSIKVEQNAGDNAKQIGQIGSAGTINL